MEESSIIFIFRKIHLKNMVFSFCSFSHKIHVSLSKYRHSFNVLLCVRRAIISTGQFSMPMDKRQPYETDIRVPLLISGPEIAPATISAPVSSVDIFATLLDIAGVEYASDGITLFKKRDNLPEDRTLLIEYRGERSRHRSSSGCSSDWDPNVTASIKSLDSSGVTLPRIELIVASYSYA